MDWQERATKEKSLGEVYWKARRVGSTKTNFRMAALVGIAFILFALADWYFDLAVFSSGELKALLNQIAEIGFALTTATETTSSISASPMEPVPMAPNSRATRCGLATC